MEGRILTVAGSDSGGGAGIQADIKTVTALGGYASSVITALTAQDTVAVRELQPVDPFFVEAQLRTVLQDIGADAIKIGMLHSKTTAELVARELIRNARHTPLVVDPVMRSSSGTELLEPAGVEVIRRRFLPMCAIITPNLEEAEVLTGQTVEQEGDMHTAADQLLMAGANAVLITGGHLKSDALVDLLRTADGDELRFEHERQKSRATHGTGCTLSSAIAAGLGQGLTLRDAVSRAVDFVQEAMRCATPIGNGNTGPMDHAFALRTRPKESRLH